MDEIVEGQLGIVVLRDPPEATIDIVAVHGLGANPDWAWIRKVKHGNNDEVKVNWLSDEHLLPASIPGARIMTFNYESRWHRDAPWQRRSLCAIQLLTALDNNRKQLGPKDKTRPIIFIGHSFGGIVIEEAMIQANPDTPFHYLSISTAGIAFLGTPHRGTEASKWGELIALSGSCFGFDTKDSILKDLKTDSETLADLLHQFALWLFRFSVPAVCFFEQHKTDYGKRFGVSWKEMVVDERSACIDGHRKVPLPTDHFKINKFEGSDDYCYKIVAPIIVDMAHGAQKIVQTRQHPRTIVEDNSLISPANLTCLQSLFLTNPADDLAQIRRTKGERVPGTCEWLLIHETYTAWSVTETSQVLRLIGGPGIGKTMISSFLVEELEQKAKRSPTMTLAYYFCDNKDERRRSALAILRGLLLQILRQLPRLSKHIQLDYDQQKDKLFDNFDALWRILLNVLEDPDAGEICLLIDALDECENPSREAFLTVLANLLRSSRLVKMRIKLLITSRPELDIQSSLSHVEKHLHVDSGKVNADLSTFIRVKTDEVSRGWPPKLSEEVRSALIEHAGGTFLWAALVLKDLRNTRPSLVSKKLKSLPSGIYEVYDRILSQIKPEDQDIAKVIFRWAALARRPLDVGGLATVLALSTGSYDGDTPPPNEDLDLFKEDFRSCEPLIYLDTRNNTINLVHQSAKDYLLGNYLESKASLSYYRVKEDATQLFLFETCWRYLSFPEFRNLWEAVILGEDGRLYDPRLFKEHFNHGQFVSYASKEWIEHALAAHRVFSNDFDWDYLKLVEVSTLRDIWLFQAAIFGQETVVRGLLEHGGSNPNSRDTSYRTPLSWAAEKGSVEVVRLLLSTTGVEPDSRDKQNRTPLSWAAEGGHVEVVRALLATTGVEPDSRNEQNRTPLSWAAEGGHFEVVRALLATTGVEPDSRDVFHRTPLSFATQEGNIEVVRILLALGVEPDSRDIIGRTPLSLATQEGNIEVFRVLLNSGVEPDSRDNEGRTPLSLAAKEGNIEVVRVLLALSVKADSRDDDGRTPLSLAAQEGYIEVVRVLLATGVEPDSRDITDWTPLSWASWRGYVEVVQVLLAIGVKPDSRDDEGRTPLSLAAENGYIEVVQVLLTTGVEPDSRDNEDRTPLSWASSGGYVEVVRVLLAIGVEPDSMDNNGRTPLSWAAEYGFIEVVRVLLATGVEPDSRDNKGRTPLSWATLGGHVEVSKLLERYRGLRF